VRLLDQDSRVPHEVTGIFKIKCVKGTREDLYAWADRVGLVRVAVAGGIGVRVYVVDDHLFGPLCYPQALDEHEGFVGRSIIEPTPGSNIWVFIVRFVDVHSLNAWKVRRSFLVIVISPASYHHHHHYYYY